MFRSEIAAKFIFSLGGNPRGCRGEDTPQRFILMATLELLSLILRVTAPRAPLRGIGSERRHNQRQREAVKNPFPPAVRLSWSPGSLSRSPTQGEPSAGSVSADPITNDFKWWSRGGNNNAVTPVSLSPSERAPLSVGRLPWRPRGERKQACCDQGLERPSTCVEGIIH